MPVKGGIITIDLAEPEATFHPPVQLKEGGHLILRGKIGTLRLSGLDGGSILDASGLEAGQINLYGKVERGSVLKLNSPKGKVVLSTRVDHKSTVEIVAPGGDVRITKMGDPVVVDGGSRLMVTAKIVEIKGEVTGDGTRVLVTLTKLGMLIAGPVQKSAVLEYRKANPTDPEVQASAGPVSPSATFRPAR